MLIKQIIEFQWRGPGPLAVHVLQLVNFMTKQKSWSRLLFTAKILQEAMCFASPIRTKSLALKILHHNARF